MMTQTATPESPTLTVQQALQSGIEALQQKRYAQAEERLRSVLQLEAPLVQAYQALGEVYFQSKQWAQSAAMLERAVTLSPQVPMAFHLLGQCYQNLNHIEQAERAFAKAAQLNPKWEAPLWMLGDMLRKKSRWTEALACYQRLTQVANDKALAKNFMAQCLQGMNRLEEAEQLYREVMQERPELPEPHCSLGALYRVTGQLDKVEASYLKAIELYPDFPEAFYNLGNFYKSQSRYSDAAEAFRQALALRPGYAEAEWNLGLVLLVQGEYREGWKSYQIRLSDPYFKILPQEKRWQGQSLEGKRILVMREQGFGDTLQFLRYTALLKQRGATVLFESKLELTPLLETCPYIDTLLPPRSIEQDPALQYDYWIPLMSLPQVFETTLDTLPEGGNLVTPDATRVKSWKARFPKKRSLRVGIAWTGNPENPYNVDREFPLEYVSQLAQTPKISFYSLQKENGLTRDVEGLKDFAPELHDFMDTAAAIENLDLVITVDSAIAHLAGAMGKPTWLVLPTVADWRWGLDREDSPWYPTVQIFRQTTPGDWKPVCKALEKALKSYKAS